MSKESTFGAFEALIGEIGSPNNSSRPGGVFPIIDPSAIEDDDPDEQVDIDEVVNPEEIIDNKEEKKEDEEIQGKEEEIEETEESSKETNKEEVGSPEDLDLGEYESDIAKVVQTKLYEKLGWDLTEEEMVDNIDSIVDALEEIVEVSSKPSFASDELEKLNSFVQNGGDIKSYFQNVYGEFDIDNMDITRESHQELVVREQLKELGLSKEAINKRIKRYSDTGILEEEASEAFDYLKNNKDVKRQKLLEDQENFKRESIKQQQEFYKNVSSTIENIENIKGIKLNKADKAKLIDYIFKPGTDGQTQYQKDYAKSSNNLIESAFFTMKGDSLIQSIQKQASSQAVKTLKEKLKTNTKLGKDNGTTQLQNDNKGDDVLTTFSRLIRPI